MEALSIAVAGAAVGALITLVGLYWLGLLQRDRTELTYRVVSASIIMPRLKQPNDDVSVAVRQHLLMAGGDPAVMVPVIDDIVGFRVSVRNSGNQVVRDQKLTFTLDPEARIIAIGPEQPPDVDYPTIATQVQHPSSNVATATIPYLNPGVSIIFSLQSVSDVDTTCRVSASAPGLTFVNRLDRARRTIPVYAVIVIALLVVPPAILRGLLEAGEIGDSYRAFIGYYLLGTVMASVVVGVLGVSPWLLARDPTPAKATQEAVANRRMPPPLDRASR